MTELEKLQRAKMYIDKLGCSIYCTHNKKD